MLAASVQMNSRDNKEENIESAITLIRKSAKRGASLVSLPEQFNFLGPEEKIADNAESIPGHTIEILQDEAKSLSMYIACGSILERPDKDEGLEKFYNTSVLLNPEGDIVAKYRKIHLFDISIKGQKTYLESKNIEPGNKSVIAKTDLGKVGLTICYDLRFPELYRKLTFDGAKIIFVPSAFTLYTGKDHWLPLLRARAIENQVYIIASAQFGKHPPNKECLGRSLIVDPWGNVIAQAENKVTFALGEIDLDFQEEIREQLPSLNHQRRDLFSFRQKTY